MTMLECKMLCISAEVFALPKQFPSYASEDPRGVYLCKLSSSSDLSPMK